MTKLRNDDNNNDDGNAHTHTHARELMPSENDDNLLSLLMHKEEPRGREARERKKFFNFVFFLIYINAAAVQIVYNL